MSTSLFDLNTEEVFENWEVEHAIREIIANALDEQVISQTAEIEISQDNRGDWHIRDFGRGSKSNTSRSMKTKRSLLPCPESSANSVWA